jgi:hypothetical protein
VWFLLGADVTRGTLPILAPAFTVGKLHLVVPLMVAVREHILCAHRMHLLAGFGLGLPQCSIDERFLYL